MSENNSAEQGEATMGSNITTASSNSLAKSVCAFLLVVFLGVGLMKVKIESTEQIRPAEDVKASAPITPEDVLSAADAREWRQEFLWHRNIRRFCPNAWIAERPCARMTQRL